MKLIKYELYKIWHHPLTVGFLIAFIIINLSVFVWQTTENQEYLISSKEEYEKLEAEYSQLPMKDAYEELSQQSAFLEKIERAEVALQYNDTAMIESIMASDPDFLDQYQQMEQMSRIPSPERRNAIHQLATQAEDIQNYPAYIDSIRQKADQMSEVSIFSQPDTFSYRNIQKTPADFEGCKDISLSFGQSAGLLAFSDFYLTDFLVLFLILQISVRLFWDEKEKGLLILVKSTVHGRMRQAITKLAALLLMGVCISLTFYGLNILTAGFIFGFGDLSRYIQSMREFSGGNILLSVREYIFAFLLGKIILCCLFAMAFSLAFSFFNNNAIALLTIFGSTGGLYFAYRAIPPLSSLNILKYLNPVAALNLRNVLSQYNNLNLFGHPCNRVVGLIISGILLGLVLGFLLIKLFVSKGKSSHSIKSLETAKTKVQAFLSKGHCVNLFGLEFRKVFCSRKIILVPVALVILCNSSIQKEEPIYSFNDTVYRNYLQSLEGELTPDKQDFLLSERGRFDHIGENKEQLESQLENGTITKNTYDYEMFLLDGFSKNQIGFERVWEQFQYLLSLQAQGVRVGFVSELSADYIFSQPVRDAVTGILWMILIVAITAVTFCQEYKKKIISILNPTYHGKGKLFCTKILVAMLLAVSFAGIYTPQYINAWHYYPLGDLSVSVRSIQKFSAIPESVSILAFLIFTHISQMIAAISAVLITAHISVKIQNQVAAMIAGSALLTIPLILFLCGASFACYFPFANPYVLSAAMGSPYGAVTAAVTMVATLVFGLFFSRQAYMLFCNQRRKKHGT